MAASLTLKLIAETAGFRQSLKKSEKDFAKFSKRLLGDARGFRKIGTELKTFGTSMTVALTAPIIGLGSVSVLAFANFEKGMNRVRALSGATGKDFEALEQQAKDLGKTTQFSATQAANAMGFLAQAGFKTNEIISAMPGVLELAAAANLDIASSADIASNVLTGYSLETQELARVNDVLVTAMTNANTDLRQLGEAMKLAGPIAKTAGLSIEETTAAIALMGNAGFQGSLAGTALRGAISRLLAPTGKAKKIIEELGLQVKDSSGKMVPFGKILQGLGPISEDAGKLMELFGQRAGPAMAALLSQGSDKLDDFTKKLKNSGGTAADIAKVQMEGLKGEFIKLASAIEGAAIEIGIVLAPAITSMVKSLQDATKWFTDLDESTRRWIIGIGVGLAAAGPVLIGLGFLVSAIGTLTPLIATVFFGPIGIIAAIVALGVWLLKATGQWGKFKESIKKTNGELIKHIKQQGFLKVALAGVLNTLTFNIAGYKRWLDILPDFGSEAEAATGELATGMQDSERASEKTKKAVQAFTGLIRTQAKPAIKAFAEEMVNAKNDGSRLFDELAKRVKEDVEANRKAALAKGKAQESLGRFILAEAQNQRKGIITSNDLIKKSADGLASSIKLLWSDTTATAKDAFKQSANVFVDVMAQMLVEAIVTGKAIQVQMAAATAGISLVIGLIASVFGGKKKDSGQAKIKQAVDNFLEEVKRSLEGFEDQTLSTLERVTRNATKSREAFDFLKRDLAALEIIKNVADTPFGQRMFIQQVFHDSIQFIQELRELGVNIANPRERVKDARKELQTFIVDNAKLSLDLIKKEFTLKKKIAEEVLNLLKREKDFLKDINSTIRGVERAFFQPKELFEAQKKDILELVGLVNVSGGEDKLTLLGDLKQAYLDSFETAKSIFEGDPDMLASWQAEVLKGLEFVREAGKDTFKSLIDVQLEALSLAKDSLVTQQSIESHIRFLGSMATNSTRLLGRIVAGEKGLNDIEILSRLLGFLTGETELRLTETGRERLGAVTKLAQGGIITKPMMAMIGEGREAEAVIPLSKLKGMIGGGGGGGVTVVNNISVQDIGQITVSQAERMLSGTFTRAAENLDRAGHVWPMQSRPKK